MRASNISYNKVVQMERNLFLGICLAPYRIDLYNYLHNNTNTDIWFLKDQLGGQELDFSLLWKECSFPKRMLRFGRFLGRQYIKGLKQLIDKTNPKVVYVSEFSVVTLQVITIRLLFRYKYKIVSISDDSLDMLDGNEYSVFHKFARNLIPRMVDNLVLSDSRSVAWYQKKFSKGLWFPIIADENRMTNKFKDSIPKSIDYFNKYNLEMKKIILFVGRLVDVKNVSTLIKAFTFLKDDNYCLVIVGDGNQREILEEQASNSKNKVIFTGKLESLELLAWYNLGDVFVLPSFKEPFGAVTNEALLSGCRVCVSEKCGSACLVTKDNGELINPNSAEQLANAILRQLSASKPNKELLDVRPSLMPFTFKRAINNIFTN